MMEPPENSPNHKPPNPLFGDMPPEGAPESHSLHPITQSALTNPSTSSAQTREAEYARIRERIAGNEELPPRTVAFRHWYQAAAAVALLLTTLVVLWWLREADQPVIFTAGNQPGQFVLPDRSVVYLKPGSTLRLAKNWDTGSRKVWLAGEGYFSVSRKEQAGKRVKFIVHTSDLDVEVLGTRFSVSQGPERTRVVLEEGKVQLRLHQTESKEIMMQPGHLVEYSSERGSLVQKRVNPQPYVAWKGKQWILNNHTLREIAIMTEETYGLRVIIEDSSLEDLQLSGKMQANDVTLLLEALSATHPISYEIVNNQIILKRKQ